MKKNGASLTEQTAETEEAKTEPEVNPEEDNSIQT